MIKLKDGFGIHIDDGSEPLNKFVVDSNMDSVTLYDWQRDAINYFFNHNGQAIFEVTTGAGKTFCSIEIIKQIWKEDPKCRVLIVVPKNVILETGWYKELYDNGISLKDIGVYYGRVKEYGKVTITNMQNLNKVALEIFDCIIFDEIHNYGTKRLLPYLQQDYKYKIGLSATLERMDDAHWDIIEYFNYNVFKYTPGDALQDGVLNPFLFTNIGIDLDGEAMILYDEQTQEINQLLQGGGGFNRIMRSKSGLKYRLLAKMNERKDLVNNYPLKFEVIKDICLKHKDDKVLVFNQFNKQTNKCYWFLLDVGLKARIIHSGVPRDKREQILSDFKNDKFNILLTSKVLDEGYNLPKLDVAIIAAGDSSPKQTIQRMGRVLRKKDKHSHLYQIYCKLTIEEKYGFERAKLFKDLCMDYDEYTFEGEIDGRGTGLWETETDSEYSNV